MTSVNCPKCGRKLSKTTASCPDCGFSTASRVVMEESARRQQPGSARPLTLFVAVFVLSFVCALRFVRTEFLNHASLNVSSPSPSASTTLTPAEKLAQLDRENVHTTATAQMQERLRRLSMKYGHGSESDVADMLVKAQELLARDGIRVSLGQIADSVEAAGPRRHMISIEELVALYVATRSSNTDAETIAQLRAFFAELGLGMGPPSESVKRRLDKLGIMSIDLAVRGRGFTGYVNLLRE